MTLRRKASGFLGLGRSICIQVDSARSYFFDFEFSTSVLGEKKEDRLTTFTNKPSMGLQGLPGQ